MQISGWIAATLGLITAATSGLLISWRLHAQNIFLAGFAPYFVGSVFPLVLILTAVVVIQGFMAYSQ